MLKKIFAALILATILLSSGLISAQQISERNAEKIVSSYAFEGEETEVFVLVYHDNKTYWIIDFVKDSDYTGSLVVDATSGDIVKDEGTARDVFYATEVIFYDRITPDKVQNDISALFDIKNAGMIFERWSAEFKEIANKTEYSQETKNKANSLATSYLLLSDGYFEVAAMLEEIIDIENQILETDKGNTDLAKAYMSKTDQIISELVAIKPDINKTMDDIIAVYGGMISDTDNQTEKANLEAEKQIVLNALSVEQKTIDYEEARWKRLKIEIDEGVVWEIERMNNRLVSFEKEVPGFEAIFTIAGLLATAHLLKRKK